VSIGNPNWKGYDTETKKPCGNWGVPGRKQIKAYKLCKKWGKDPQKDFNRIWDMWLNELSNNEAQLEEMRQKRDYLNTQIELIEKTNGNSIIINEKLLRDIDEHINQITEGSTYRWGYAITKKLSNRHDLAFNEVIKIFDERVPALIKNNEYRERLLYFFRYIGDRAKNGALSDTEIDMQFPITARVSA
jgi:hypothetical protein